MSNSTALTVRPATEADVKAIFALLELYAAKKIVLQRSEADIRYYLANFSVAEREGELVGCVAMRDFGNDLLEIRSLVVAPELQNTGVGRALVEYCIRKLRNSRQRFRLFALTLKADANVLLLDEPTNDIDVNTLRALEEGLENFAGCAVVVSHDRWFLDRICTHILSFEGDSNVVFYEGTYSEYEEYKRKTLGDAEPKRVRYRKLIVD